VIVPVFNEAEGLISFNRALLNSLDGKGWRYEVIYVDDGSTDGSAEVIKEIAQDHAAVQPIYLSRNFGKEQATTAGLHAAKGDAAIMLDADGQHPIELIPEFVKRWQHGAQVVIGVRVANQKEGFVKRAGSKSFYRTLRLLGAPGIVPGSTDFRLVDKQVLVAFRQLTEHNRITRALIDWVGFDREYISFVANPREHGKATYSNKKLLKLAINSFVSLSFAPLYLSGYLGVVITLLSFMAGIFAILEKYAFGDPFGLNITGTAILGLMILFLVGILLIGQGLLAVYVARIYTETQNRPLYVAKN
jgi:polyisoprenyl-phosphate glycosyltransferase